MIFTGGTANCRVGKAIVTKMGEGELTKIQKFKGTFLLIWQGYKSNLYNTNIPQPTSQHSSIRVWNFKMHKQILILENKRENISQQPP